MKSLVKIFGLLALMAILFVGCPDPNGWDKPNTPSEPFANLTEDTAHPMKYVIDLADVMDFLKGKNDAVSDDGTLTILDNIWGDLNESDRQIGIDIQGMLKNNLPKAGDIVELHAKFTSDIEIDNLQIMFVDGNEITGGWAEVAERVKFAKLDSPIRISDAEENKFVISCPIINDCFMKFTICIAYGKHNGNGANAKFNFNHCAETKVEKMENPGPQKVTVISGSDLPGINLKINMDVPADASKLDVTVYDSEDANYFYVASFDKNDKTINLPNVTSGKTYFLKVKFDCTDNHWPADAMLRVKAESGEGFEKAFLLSDVSDDGYNGLKLKYTGEVPADAHHGVIVVTDISDFTTSPSYEIKDFSTDICEWKIPYVTKENIYKIELRYENSDWKKIYSTAIKTTAQSGIGFAKLTKTPEIKQTNGFIEFTTQPEYSFDAASIDECHYWGDIFERNWENYYGNFNLSPAENLKIEPFNLAKIINNNGYAPEKEVFFTLKFIWKLEDDPNEYRIAAYDDYYYFFIDWDAVE